MEARGVASSVVNSLLSGTDRSVAVIDILNLKFCIVCGELQNGS